jgi:hypothetical protein
MIGFVPRCERSPVYRLEVVDARISFTFTLKVSHVTSHFTLSRSLLPFVVVLLCLIRVEGGCQSHRCLFGVAELLEFLVAIGNPVF